MDSKNNQRGITLIALIITIIVMLILVAVTVSVAIDGNLFGKAEEAVDKTNAKVGSLQQDVDYYTNKLNEYSNKNTNVETTYKIYREYYIDGERLAKMGNPGIAGNVGDVIKGAELNNNNPNWAYYTIPPDGTRLEFIYSNSNPNSLT